MCRQVKWTKTQLGILSISIDDEAVKQIETDECSTQTYPFPGFRAALDLNILLLELPKDDIDVF